MQIDKNQDEVSFNYDYKAIFCQETDSILSPLSKPEAQYELYVHVKTSVSSHKSKWFVL